MCGMKQQLQTYMKGQDIKIYEAVIIRITFPLLVLKRSGV